MKWERGLSRQIVTVGRACAHRSTYLAILLAIACAQALTTASPALAINARGHAFGFDFGEKGSAGNQFEEPVGVAVDEATGELYVADRPLKRIDRYQCPVTQEEAENEQSRSCTFLSSFSIGGPAEAIAVDNSATAGDPSAGDVYVASGKAVLKFTPAGSEIDKIKEFVPGEKLEEEKERVLGVAVDSQGNLWADYGEELEGSVATFNDAEHNVLTQEGFESELKQPFDSNENVPLRRGLAVDSKEHVYINYEEFESKRRCKSAPCQIGEIATPQSFAAEGELVEVEPGEALRQSYGRANSTGVALDLPDGNEVYVDNETSVAAYLPTGELVQRFGVGHLQAGAGLAVDSRSDAVYVADVQQGDIQVFVPTPAHEPVVVSERVAEVNTEAGSATLEAEINSSGAATNCSFAYGTSEAYGHIAGCENEIGPGFESQRASVHISGLLAGTVYHFRVAAENGHGGQVSGPDRAFTQREGLIDGREWEMVSSAKKSGASILPIGEETTSQGIMRSSLNGRAISYTADIPTEPNTQGARSPERTQIISTRGPSGWSSHEITAADNAKGGFTGPGEPPEYRFFSEDLALSLVVPFRHPKENPETELLAEPPLSPPVTYEHEGKQLTEAEDEQEKTIYVRADAPVKPSKPSEETLEATAYGEAEANLAKEAELHGAGSVQAQAGFLALLTKGDTLAEARFGGAGPAVQFLDATPGLAHVVVNSTVTLASSGAPGLYEWNAGEPHSQIQQVSVLPGGVSATGPLRLGAGFNTRNAISKDGSRVVWEAGPENGALTHLYVRQMPHEGEAGETLELGEPVIGTPIKAQVGAIFQDASPDGSKIFFTDEQKLTPESGAGLEKPELYVCEVQENAEHHLACKTRDLSETHAGEAGEVQGTVIGLSEAGCEAGSTEGCLVYFVANGALSQNAGKGDCVQVPGENETYWAGRTCNLYVRERNAGNGAWEEPTLIATLANADRPDWGSTQTGGRLPFDPSHITSRVSPNGTYLAFMSMEPLTEYDNTDVKGGAPDEEVYLYDAGTNDLACASCSPDGLAPEGIPDNEAVAEEEGEGPTLLVDRNGIWVKVGEGIFESVDLAGNIPGWTPLSTKEALQQSRYLNDEGRLYFDASDGLVPRDTNGKEDVYEYEPEGIGGCLSSSDTNTEAFVPSARGCVALISSGKSERESAFFEASATGTDVFFLSAQKISKSDHDTNFDVYDAHECTVDSPCAPPPAEPPGPCENEEGCKGAPPVAAPESTSAGSSTFSGPGNPTPKTGVLSLQSSESPKQAPPKPLTRAQKLANALKACKKDSKRAKRVACERAARKKYGPPAKSKKKGAKK